MRVTGDYAGLYKAALANLEAAGPEEKAMGQWAKDKAALTEGLKQATAKPGVAPSGIDGDPVAAYLKDVGGVVANPAHPRHRQGRLRRPLGARQAVRLGHRGRGWPPRPTTARSTSPSSTTARWPPWP
jgi:hypothetical protein